MKIDIIFEISDVDLRLKSVCFMKKKRFCDN